MAQDTALADAVLKNYYLPVTREMINQKAVLLFGYSPDELTQGFGTANASKGETLDYKGISRDADMVQFAGRQWIFTAHTKRNESGTMRDENGTLPAAGQQGYEDFQDKVRRAYKQIQISGFAIAVSERDVGAYLRLLQGETEGAINDLRRDLSRQAYGDQTGALAAVTADGVNTVTVDSVQYLRVNMVIDLINSTNDAVLAADRTITAIVASTGVVTYSGADVTATTDHRVVEAGNWKKEINGLKNMLGPDGSLYNTLHGVDGSVAGNEYWRAKVKDALGGVWDEDLGQQLLDEIGAEGWETSIIITTRGVRRRYVNTLKAMKRWNDTQSQTMHGGFKFVDFNGYPLLTDDQCPKKEAWFLRPEDFLWIWLHGNDFDWMDRDGAVLRKVESPDTDAYKATLFKYCDLGLFRRKSQGRMKNLADDAAVITS